VTIPATDAQLRRFAELCQRVVVEADALEQSVRSADPARKLNGIHTAREQAETWLRDARSDQLARRATGLGMGRAWSDWNYGPPGRGLSEAISDAEDYWADHLNAGEFHREP
jgi:hypothetical protein